MIKARELRIENLVLCRGAISVVTSVDMFSVGYLTQSGKGERKIPLRLVKPIKLTEEILLKCGFSKRSGIYVKHGFPFSLCKDGEFYESDELPTFIFLQHLHQLQNLYFALTGEELNVEL